MITKTDFMLFLESPMHFWASKNEKLTITAPSLYDQHLMQQGYQVENLARKKFPNVDWQKTFDHDTFEIRTDALVDNQDGTFDVYEVKSATDIEKEHLYDLTFQSIVLKNNLMVKNYYIITLNKDYSRGDEIDMDLIFTKHDVTKEVFKLTNEVEEKMRQAKSVLEKASHEYIENCLDPKNCPCLNLCYPNLPEKSIFHIPHLHATKKRQLVDSRILDIASIPFSFEISAKQRLIANTIINGNPHINRDGLKSFLSSLKYPLYFLDYETYASAIPLYKGNKPYQQIVFQYSLHKLLEDGTIEHYEYLEEEDIDPSEKLLSKLQKEIGTEGSVLVWNKGFEHSRNKELAESYPKYAEFLNNVNSRMIDLADFINKEHYIHPEFLGSWSIKNVLPVMVPELSYKELKVNKGDAAMLAWWDMVHGTDKSAAKDLLEYCALDTLAMVKIWEKLKSI